MLEAGKNQKPDTRSWMPAFAKAMVGKLDVCPLTLPSTRWGEKVFLFSLLPFREKVSLPDCMAGGDEGLFLPLPAANL